MSFKKVKRCKASAFLTVDFRTVLSSSKKPKEIPQKVKGNWQVMEKILLRVIFICLGRLSQDHVILCHLLLELDKFSAAYLAHTLFLISDGILLKKEVNSASGFNTRFLCSWS